MYAVNSVMMITMITQICRYRVFIHLPTPLLIFGQFKHWLNVCIVIHGDISPRSGSDVNGVIKWQLASYD